MLSEFFAVYDAGCAEVTKAAGGQQARAEYAVQLVASVLIIHGTGNARLGDEVERRSLEICPADIHTPVKQDGEAKACAGIDFHHAYAVSLAAVERIALYAADLGYVAEIPVEFLTIHVFSE